jgi:hypothetical protein
MVMVGAAAAEPGEEIFETVVVEESVQIEACHLFKPLTQRPHELENHHRTLGKARVMRGEGREAGSFAYIEGETTKRASGWTCTRRFCAS